MDSLDFLKNLILNPDYMGQLIYFFLLSGFFVVVYSLIKRESIKDQENDSRKKYLEDIKRIMKDNRDDSRKIFDAIRYTNDFEARRK